MYVSRSSFIMKVLMKVLCFESEHSNWCYGMSPPLPSPRCERLLARLFVALFAKTMPLYSQTAAKIAEPELGSITTLETDDQSFGSDG